MSETTKLTLDTDEPHTPTWFTILGIGLFLVAGLLFLALSGEGAAQDEAESSDQAATAVPQVVPSPAE